MFEITRPPSPSLVPSSVLVHGRPQNKLGASDDTHAARMWLAEQTNPETRRQYELHAKRLIAWLESVQLTLDSCTFVDMSSYLNQLDNPTALTTHIERCVPLTEQAKYRRLFASRSELASNPKTPRKLSGASLRALPKSKPLARAARARKILLSMIRWLQENGYIATFAMPRPQLPNATEISDSAEAATNQASMARKASQDTDMIDLWRAQIRSRLLTEAQWAIIDHTIDRLDWTDATFARCRLVATWLRESGVRRAELAAARFEHMEWVLHEDSGTHFWLWKVIGKGDKIRYVPLTPAMMDSYKRFRLSMYLPYFEHDAFLAPDPSAFIFSDLGTIKHKLNAKRKPKAQTIPGDKPALSQRDENRPPSGTMIYNDICRLADLASKCNPPVVDERIAKLSPHWFRHRRAHDLLKKLHITKVAQYLGHASIETTKIYGFSEEVQLGHEVLNASLP